MERRVDAPHFLVTFTLPEALREMLFGPLAKDAYGIFFRAVSAALEQTLASPKNRWGRPPSGSPRSCTLGTSSCWEIRYHGYHPAAKKNRERVSFLAGGMLVIGRATPPPQAPARPGWLCACCGKAMALLDRIPKPDRMSHLRSRAPPKPCAA